MPTLAQVRKKCLVAIQLLARISAADEYGYVECVSCGVVKHYRDGMHGGHYISKGRGGTHHLALEITNVHAQCAGCNLQMGKGAGTVAHNYQKWMYDYYGKDYVDEMVSRPNAVKKISLPEYEDILAELQEQIKYHEQRIII